MVKFINPNEAADLIEDNKVIAISGFAGLGVPEALLRSLEEKFLKQNSPRNLTLMFAAGQGDGDSRGLNHLAHEGLVKKVIGGHFNLVPKLGKLMIENKIEAYNLPQGVMCHLFRDIARKKIGTITRVGLNTFVDPRIEGGKVNSITKEDIVQIINVLGQENLLYKAQNIDIAFIKATYADENGNISMEHEATLSEATCIAQAVKNSGGIVIVQVDSVLKAGTLDPRNIKIPKIYVDYIVEIENKEENEQVLGHYYDPSLCGERRICVNNTDTLDLNARKIIGRRAAMELVDGSVVNLGIGMPEAISSVANEEGICDFMTLTVEPGPIGGIPQGGRKFGACINPECILDQPTQFDFYDGGGLDIAFLGLAQADKRGNINVSKFGSRLAGCGGFINITQNAKKVVFCGTFTVKGFEAEGNDGKLEILHEGANNKFIDKVEQITFSGDYARKLKQQVLYITERAVFELKEDGLHLTEIAPGIDLENDILKLMDFKPIIDKKIKLMDERIFKDELMNLKGRA